VEAHRLEPADGVTYFVTNNSADFGRDKLLPFLQQEVDAVATTASFHYLNSMTGLLEELAAPTGEGPSGDDLLAFDELYATVGEALRSVDVVGGNRPATYVTRWSPDLQPAMTRGSLLTEARAFRRQRRRCAAY
jgi:hypothetical protein